VEPRLANIETGEILLVPKVSDIWCRNSDLAPERGVAVLLASFPYNEASPVIE
jgi:hypothetical protein